MEDQVKKDVKKILDTKEGIRLFDEKLGQSLKSVIFDKNNKEIMKKIKDQIHDGLSKLVDDNKIETVRDVVANTRWTNMTIREKIKWFIFNKIFKSWGRDIRKYIDEINLNEFELVNAVNKLQKDDEDDKEPNIIEYPNYAILCPRSIIDTNFSVMINKPLEYVKFDIKV